MSHRLNGGGDSGSTLSKGVPLNTLTQNMIVKACVDQGFYRTPACNDKLYLHHRALESIDPRAFEAYTQVKVLWLEGNLLKRIACGDDASFTEDVNREASSSVCDGASKSATSVKGGSNVHVPDEGEVAASETETATTTTPAAAAAAAHDDDDVNDANHGSLVAATQSNNQQKDGAHGLDIFSTMYPTLRQLYLHNNMLGEMPDLGKFENLDSVNLSNNSITRVRSGCSYWKAFLKERESVIEEVPAEDSSSKKGTEEDGPTMIEGSSKSALVASRPVHDAGRTKVLSVKLAEIVDESCVGHWTTICKHEATTPQSDQAQTRYNSTVPSCFRKDASQQNISLTEVQPTCHADPNEMLADDELSAAHEQTAHQCPCCTLTTLNLAGNSIRDVDNLAELLCYKRLVSLDLSNNMIADGEGLVCLLSKLGEQHNGGEPHLRSVRLSGNPFLRKMTNYRKRILSAIPSLYHLDDRPVFPDERRLVTAWARGGTAAEQKEREFIRAEAEKKEKDRLAAFRSLVNRVRQNRGSSDTVANGQDDDDCPSVSVRRPPVGTLVEVRQSADPHPSSAATAAGEENGDESDSETSTDASSDSDEEEYEDVTHCIQRRTKAADSGLAQNASYSKSEGVSAETASRGTTDIKPTTTTTTAATEASPVENLDDVWIPE